MIDKLELLSKKMDRIKVLMDLTGESMEQMLSYYAAGLIKCEKCPLLDKCTVRTNHKSCNNMWLEFLEASDE